MSTLLSSQSQTVATAVNPTVNSSDSIRQHIAKCYQADQQVKYLHLQAEIDVLIQQLEALKKTKQ